MAFAIRAAHPMSDMNVTPLVDVMLVMLIIFMITMPMLTRTLTVPLPVPVPPDRVLPEPPVPLELMVDASGAVSIGGQALSPAQLRVRLEEVAAASVGPRGEPSVEAQPRVRLLADDGASYQSVTAVMAAVSNAGLERLELVEASR